MSQPRRRESPLPPRMSVRGPPRDYERPERPLSPDRRRGERYGERRPERYRSRSPPPPAMAVRDPRDHYHRYSWSSHRNYLSSQPTQILLTNLYFDRGFCFQFQHSAILKFFELFLIIPPFLFLSYSTRILSCKSVIKTVGRFSSLTTKLLLSLNKVKIGR